MTRFLFAVAVALGTWIAAAPSAHAGQLPCALYCSCDTPCSAICTTGGHVTTCRSYGLCKDYHPMGCARANPLATASRPTSSPMCRPGGDDVAPATPSAPKRRA